MAPHKPAVQLPSHPSPNTASSPSSSPTILLLAPPCARPHLHLLAQACRHLLPGADQEELAARHIQQLCVFGGGAGRMDRAQKPYGSAHAQACAVGCGQDSAALLHSTPPWHLGVAWRDPAVGPKLLLLVTAVLGPIGQAGVGFSVCLRVLQTAAGWGRAVLSAPAGVAAALGPGFELVSWAHRLALSAGCRQRKVVF